MSTYRGNWLSNEPNKEVVGTGDIENPFLSGFAINKSYLQMLQYLLTDATYFESFKLLFSNFDDFLTSIMVFPFRIPLYDNVLRYVKLGDLNTKDLENFVVLGKTPKFLYNNELVELGSKRITPKFNNFMDYEGFTSIDVFLPFLGFISVNPSDVMGKYLYVDLYIDYFTGQGLYYISVNENANADTKDRRLINKYSVQLGYTLPIGKTNALENTRNMIMGSASSLLKGGINPSSLVNVGESIVNNLSVNATTEKTNNSILDCATSKYVKIVIKRPTPQDLDENEYLKLYGKPLESTILLEDEKGFTKIEKINLVNTTLTDDEKDELMNILKEGVIL